MAHKTSAMLDGVRAGGSTQPMPNLTVNFALPELQTLLELGDMKLSQRKVHQSQTGHISYSEKLRLAGFIDAEPQRGVLCG